jgi:hypothetical protein
MNINGNWYGTLNSFEGGSGYWIIATDNFVFEYNNPGLSLEVAKSNELPEAPNGLEYYQSILQSFYFIEDLELENTEIEIGDWIVAYNGETVVGSRQWDGKYTDIPVMGYAPGDDGTVGFCKSGDIPTFKLHKSSTSQVIDLISNNIPEWENNSAVIINLSGIEFPFEVTLHNAYPNPFNPSTTIHYDIPEGGMDVNLSIYDIRGRLVSELVNEFQNASHNGYEILWDASNMSSGVYFVKLHAGSTIRTQKLMLIK